MILLDYVPAPVSPTCPGVSFQKLFDVKGVAKRELPTYIEPNDDSPTDTQLWPRASLSLEEIEQKKLRHNQDGKWANTMDRYK